MNDDFLRTLQAYMVGVDPALANFFKPECTNGRNETQEENGGLHQGSGPARCKAASACDGPVQSGGA